MLQVCTVLPVSLEKHIPFRMKNPLVYILVMLFISVSLYADTHSVPLDWQLSGRLFLDGGIYTGAPEVFHNGAAIPDIRLGAKVNIFSDWYTKIDIGFAKNKVALKDAFVQYRRNVNYFRLGYMIGYFSMDESNSTNDYFFHTAAPVAEAFYPGRRIGFSYTRSAAFYYLSAGAFCGDELNFSENIRQGYNFTGRAVWRPFSRPDRLLHIGGGVLYKVPDKNTDTGNRSVSLGTKGVTYLGSPRTTFITLEQVSHQMQANIECLAFLGKWLLQGEYLWTGIRQEGACPSYNARGGYVQGGVLLKGSQLNYDETDALPVMPSGSHAVMLMCRYNITDLNDRAAGLFGGRQQDVSVGLNYYLNKYICAKINYSRLWLDRYSAVGKCRYGMLQARLQVRF